MKNTKEIEPTIRQKKAFDLIVSGKVKSKREAMKLAGYSVDVQNKPNKVTEKAGWATLLRRHIPENLVLKKHKAMLEKMETVHTFNKDGQLVVESTGEIDVNSVAKGVDLYYKVAGKYPKEGNVTAIQVNVGADRQEFST
jgi:predicted SpoU family rRNA methylase